MEERVLECEGGGSAWMGVGGGGGEWRRGRARAEKLQYCTRYDSTAMDAGLGRAEYWMRVQIHEASWLAQATATLWTLLDRDSPTNGSNVSTYKRRFTLRRIEGEGSKKSPFASHRHVRCAVGPVLGASLECWRHSSPRTVSCSRRLHTVLGHSPQAAIGSQECGRM